MAVVYDATGVGQSGSSTGRTALSFALRPVAVSGTAGGQ